MKISKTILLSDTDNLPISNMCGYWEERGMKFSSKTRQQLKGARGSLWGNLVAFKMNKIMTRLEIDIQSDRIECCVHIDTLFQYITQANKKFFEFELDDFERHLLHHPSSIENWEHLLKNDKQTGLLLTFLTPIVVFLLFLAL